ncbi:MAG: hypothetical protein D6805_08285 [Planctomycetota bacterium]|nr:MAG: hypothetical protein D6805_08285 [Planctomycetota bacterium]
MGEGGRGNTFFKKGFPYVLKVFGGSKPFFKKVLRVKEKKRRRWPCPLCPSWPTSPLQCSREAGQEQAI